MFDLNIKQKTYSIIFSDNYFAVHVGKIGENILAQRSDSSESRPQKARSELYSKKLSLELLPCVYIHRHRTSEQQDQKYL